LTIIEKCKDSDQYNQVHFRYVYDYLLSRAIAVPAWLVFWQNMREQIELSWEQGLRTGVLEGFPITMHKVFDNLDLEQSDELVEACTVAFSWQGLPCVKLYPDVRSTLLRLKNDGLRLGVFSNSFFPYVMRQVEFWRFGLIDCFCYGATAADVGWLKPDRRAFEGACAGLAERPGNVAYVGDDLIVDIEGARQAGLKTIWYQPGVRAKCTLIQPDKVIHSISELGACIKTFC